MVGLGGGCIATRGYFPSKVWDLSQHTDICVLCDDYNDPLRSHWRSAIGYSYLLMMLSGLPLHYYRYLFIAYVG